MDNISIKWLPDNLDTEVTSAHNGENYISYTFYLVNNGTEMVYYWYEIDTAEYIKDGKEGNLFV